MIARPPFNAKRTWTWPWQTTQGIFWSLCYLAAVAFAYHVPMDVLDKYPYAKGLVDFMSSWNMQIRRVGEISGPVGQANLFVYSVLWCVMPAAWLTLAWDVYKKKKPTNFVIEEKSWFQFWIVTVGLAGLAYGLFVLTGDINSRIGRAMFISHLSRSFFAPLVVFWGIGFLMGTGYSIWVCLTRRVRIVGGLRGR